MLAQFDDDVRALFAREGFPKEAFGSEASEDVHSNAAMDSQLVLNVL